MVRWLRSRLGWQPPPTPAPGRARRLAPLLSPLLLCAALVAAAGPIPPAATDLADAVATAVAGPQDVARLTSVANRFRAWQTLPGDRALAAAAVTLARTCRVRKACDPYYPLRYAHWHRAMADDAMKPALARELLGADLPWYAVDALAGAGALSAEGRDLLGRAQAAMQVTREDAAAALPANRVAAGTPLATRLWWLIGVPSLDKSGDYLSADFAYAPRNTDAFQMSPEEEGQTALWRHADGLRSTLAALAHKAYLPAVERGYGLTSPNRTSAALPVSPADFRRLVAETQREIAGIDQRRGENDWFGGDPAGTGPTPARTALVAMLGAALPDLLPVPGLDEPAQPAGGPDLSVRPKQILAAPGLWVVLLSDSIMVAVTQHGDQLRAWSLGLATSVTFRNVDGQPGDEVVAMASEGSGGFLTLTVFDPRQGQVSLLAPELGHGQYAFVNLDDDPALEVLVSTVDEYRTRFMDCNQCAKRRQAYVLDYDDTTRRYRVAGMMQTGADDASITSGNLFGISPTMSAHLQEGTGRSALARLRRSEHAAAADVEAVIGYADLVSDSGAHADALRYLDVVLSKPGTAEALPELYAQAVANAALAELQLGRPVAALARLDRVPADLLARHPDFAQGYWSLVGSAAASIGDGTRGYAAFGRQRQLSPPNERSPSEGNMAVLLGQVGARRAAADQTLAALASSVREENWRGRALMMIAAADAERQAGRLQSAVDWLGRALRITRSFRDSGPTAAAFKVAAAVAVDAHLPDLAIALLEVNLLSYTEDMWRPQGPAYLLLYARALEQKGQAAEAGRVYRAAAALSDQTAGLQSVQAWGELGRFALARSDRAGARGGYDAAFARIAQGRRYTPTEDFKIGFLQNVDTIVERHFSLMPDGREADARAAADLEAWKFQVFRDVYAARAPPAAAESGLQPDEAYISFFVSDPVSFAVVKTASGTRRVPLAITATEARRLRAAILRFMNPADPLAAAYIRQRKMPPALADLLEEARARLIAPLDLPGSVNTLLLNEDEDIAGIPWPAVPDRADGWLDAIRRWLGLVRVRSLLDRYDVVLAPSLEFARPHPPGGAPRLLVAAAVRPIGADVVNRALGIAAREQRYGGLPALPQGAGEIAAVAGSAAGGAVLSDAPAPAQGLLRRDALQARLRTATMWHFVGHGVFNRVDPMESLIFLGGTRDPEWLTARELSRWDLRHLRLVSLSACETGTARPESGGETFGMVRGLLAAGVQSTLVMNWAVDDRATALFYRTFYDGVAHGSRGDAYRAAALGTRDRFTHPFYWAAAQLYGDYR